MSKKVARLLLDGLGLDSKGLDENQAKINIGVDVEGPHERYNCQSRDFDSAQAEQQVLGLKRLTSAAATALTAEVSNKRISFSQPHPLFITLVN